MTSRTTTWSNGTKGAGGVYANGNCIEGNRLVYCMCMSVLEILTSSCFSVKEWKENACIFHFIETEVGQIWTKRPFGPLSPFER